MSLMFSSWIWRSHSLRHFTLLLKPLQWHSIPCSLTQSLTYLILINLFIKLGLNVLLLLSLLIIILLFFQVPYSHTCMFYNLQTNIVSSPPGIQCSVFAVSGISQDDNTNNDILQKCFFLAITAISVGALCC